MGGDALFHQKRSLAVKEEWGVCGGQGTRRGTGRDWVLLMCLWFSVALKKNLRGVFKNVSSLGNMVEQVRNCRTVLI